MVRVSAAGKLCLCVPVALGIAAGILGSYPLAALSFVFLFAAISLMPSLKGCRFPFLFFFLFLTALPINIRAARDLYILLNGGEDFVITVLCMLLPFIFFSIEIIASGIVSYFLWGERDDLPAAEKEKQREEKWISHFNHPYDS